MTVVVTPMTWREVRSIADPLLSVELRAELGKLESQRVVHLSLPYGTPLIEAGRFCWELLEENRGWEASYCESIPLVLVANRTVELSDVVTTMSSRSSKRNSPQAPRPISRAAPLYMTRSGEFFGLFQNFADDIGQEPINATAGGTTLMVLPPIGDAKHLGQFLRGIGIERTQRQRERIVADLQLGTGSHMTFGAFFADLLARTDCDWRCEVIVFSPDFVAKIDQQPKAQAAMQNVTLKQMSLSHRRANVIIDVYRRSADEEGARLDHVQSLQFIARNTRPGFTAVVGTAADEQVLPAESLHAMVYPADDEDRAALDPHMCFPHVFRPSLPGETSFYFLNRPYSPVYTRPGERAEERVERVIESLEHNGSRAYGSFWHATAARLYEHLDASARPARPIKLPHADANLISRGIIGFTPKAPDPC